MALDTSDVLAVTAIVIASIALLSTFSQILQQYIGTSEGYRRCQASVMGRWSEATRRKFHYGEMKFEVFFETPEFVIVGTSELSAFVTIRSLEERRGLAPIDGTVQSYKATRTNPGTGGVTWWEDTTSDDEEASWVLILEVLQYAEKLSRKWDQSQLAGREGHLRNDPQRGYNFRLGVRKKRQSWKFVPSGVIKPYASTNISTLIQIVALLGMHWVAFDQASGNVVAEGNGIVLTSALVQGLGMLVSFSITDTPVFRAQRLIPNSEVGNLCFGSVRSIATVHVADYRLRFGSAQQESDTLEMLDCHLSTIKLFHYGHQHIFSVLFEILGMLGATFRIRNSGFRRIPNPTRDAWPDKYLLPLVLLDAFQHNLQNYLKESDIESRHEIQSIVQQCRRILNTARSSLDSIDCDTLEAVHDAIDTSTELLTNWPAASFLSIVGTHVASVIARLGDPLSPFNYLRRGFKKALDPSDPEHPQRRLIALYFESIFPDLSHLTKNSDGEEDPNTKVLWLLLVFRMLCWLTLHDFDPEDIRIIPSNLMHSRVPVYIG